jgi:hypothetical protein
MKGAHFGCNYLALPGTICNKCGMYIKIDPQYEWCEYFELVMYRTALCPLNSKWEIDAEIQVNNQGGAHSAQIEVSLYSEKSTGSDGVGQRLVANKDWFIFDMGRGSVEDLKLICEGFYEKNLKDKELTMEFLQGLHQSLSV